MIVTLLRDGKIRSLAIQVGLVGAVLTGLAVLIATTIENLKARGIPLGYDFITRPSGMPIAETFLAFSPEDSYGRAILVGLANTLVVAGLAIVFATIAGLLVGVGRLSENPLMRGLCRIWVEVTRNTPAIVLFLLLYALWWQVLPPVQGAIELMPGTYISQRGLVMPRFSVDLESTTILVLAAAASTVLWLASRAARRIQDRTGRRPPYASMAAGALGFAMLAAFITGATSISTEWPEFQRYNYDGGLVLTPELTTIVVGLTVYTAGFIAEIVRGSILAIGKGQWEAGRSIGLSEVKILRLVIIPQTLRVIVPPLTSQYINVVKNSTLAIVVGFQDFMTVLQTIINQTSHAIEGVAIIIGVYLAINIALSLLLNGLNRRIAIVER